jgi:ATP-dependent RNA helicase DDX6/DHH1
MILARKSIIARAKNGTGKTGAFIIPLLNEMRETSKDIQAVILVPTRELALQIQALAQKLSKFSKINIEFFIGGTMVKEDYNKIEDRNIQMVVCTPGRLKDLVKKYDTLLDKC